jgi:hypothetical protein
VEFIFNGCIGALGSLLLAVDDVAEFCVADWNTANFEREYIYINLPYEFISIKCRID